MPPSSALHRNSTRSRSSENPNRLNTRQTRESGTPPSATLSAHQPLENSNLRANAHNKPSLRLKANIVIATLNVNGYAAPASNMSGIDKWSTINRTINTNRIAILAIQETHLDEHLLQQINTCFGTRLEIIPSMPPENPRATAGVAFVINKTMLQPRETKTYELIPGRATALKIKWLEDEEILLINVYAPNDRGEQVTFWESIDTRRRELHLRRPDLMLGDFNVTEEQLDRAPAHPDDPRAIDALRSLRHRLNLQDSWRHSFPND